jgi:hypothetical protein
MHLFDPFLDHDYYFKLLHNVTDVADSTARAVQSIGFMELGYSRMLNSVTHSRRCDFRYLTDEWHLVSK